MPQSAQRPLPGRPGGRAGDGAPLPWPVRLVYDILGLHPGGELEALRERSAELRARQQAGERGLTARIAAYEAKIDETLLSDNSRRTSRRRFRVALAVMLVVAAVLVLLIGGGASSTLVGLSTISIVVGQTAVRLALRRRRRDAGRGSRRGR